MVILSSRAVLTGIMIWSYAYKNQWRMESRSTSQPALFAGKQVSISFTIHFPSCLSSKSCILAFPATKLHTSFSFSLLPTISSHMLVSKSHYYSFAHRFYSSFHFVLLPLPYYRSHASLFTSLVIIHMPQTSTTHSPSFHVIIYS